MHITAVFIIFLLARQLHKHYTYHIYIQNKKTTAREIMTKKLFSSSFRLHPFTLQVGVFLRLTQGPLASELPGGL